MANALIQNYVGLALVAIMGIGVTYRIIQDVVSSANLSGTDATLANILGTLVIVGVLVAIVSTY